MTPPQPPLPPMSRHRRPSAHSIARLETVVEAVEEQQSGRVPRVEDGTTGRTVTSESATSSPTASRRPRRIVVSWGSGSASAAGAAGAAGASTAGASTTAASTTTASATGANSTTRPRTTSSTSSMRSSSHRLPILRQQRALSTASMHNPPVAVPTSPVVGSITSITSPLLPATPAASPVAQQQQHLTPHTKRLGDQLLLMEFELLDALERNGVKGKEEGTMMTTTANAGSSSRYGMSSSPIPIHGRSSMSTELARRESIGSATAHASRTTTAHTMSPPATPPPGSAGNKFLSSADPAKIAALRAFHRKHRRAFLWACGTGLLLLLVTIITLALVLPTCSLLGCHVPTLYEELMGIVMRQNGTMALFKAGELEAYPRLKELAVFLGSTTTKSFGSQGYVEADV